MGGTGVHGVASGPRAVRGRAFRAAGVAIGLALGFALGFALGLVGPAVAAGPPYPDQVPGQAVYDTAGVFRADTITSVEQTIASIKERTGAEVVVYTQVKPESDTPDLAQADAIALGNQWAVGRKGFDDGLVILFDLNESRIHGQVQLYAGDGYRAAYLSNGERQAIYENDMLPLLRNADLDGALLAAMAKIDAAATPEHANNLQTARQLDAALGLVVGPALLLLVVGWAAWSWLRFGRDPVYLDDPSIHIPAPPPDLTPASGALVHDGSTGRRALTTAMLDLAARGLLTFRQDKGGPFGLGRTKLGIDTNTRPPTDAQDALCQETVARATLGPAEKYALSQIQLLGLKDGDRFVDDKALLGFGSSVGGFEDRLEDHVVRHGWFAEAPRKTRARWQLRGGLVIGAGIAALVAALNLPSQGLVLIGVCLAVAGAVTFAVALAMPARTMAGAMIRAMLAAYRRTLEKTMAQARSMDDVVATAGLPWLQTPDQAVVWGVALGLQHDVEQVLERSMTDVREGRASATYVPTWYVSGSGGSSLATAGGGGGLMSSSAIPNFGGMMAALGTIGNAPSSSGSGGGGSFGGGGGAGGGF